MGRNNHHAGMHMIWYRRYGEYDDLAYYDELARKNANKTAGVGVSKQVQEQNDTAKVKEERNTKMPIEVEHFVYANVVMANIMIFAIKNKKDIVDIVNRVETLMRTDVRTNPTSKSPWANVPKMENAFRFLSILASELECSVAEIMSDDEYFRRKFAYDLLESLDDLEGDFVCDIEDGYAELTIDDFDYKYGLTKQLGRSIYDRVSLTINKETFDDGEVYYSLSVGCLLLDDKTSEKYILKGAYIWEEDEGYLKDFTERIIALD